MLRFFRQIRQRLLTQNKLSKYLLYAVGEVLLVVLGILIAIGVDNWNEDREQESEFRIALANLLIDLNDDLGHFRILDSVNTDNINNAEIQINILARPNTTDDIGIIQGHPIYFMNLDYTRDTYTSIVNSDMFHHSRNQTLKSALSDYYREAGDTQAVFERIISWQRDLLFKDDMLRYRYLNTEESLSSQNQEIIQWMDRPYSKDYLALSTWLSEVKRTGKIREIRFQGLREQNQFLQKEIQIYLKRD